MLAFDDCAAAGSSGIEFDIAGTVASFDSQKCLEAHNAFAVRTVLTVNLERQRVQRTRASNLARKEESKQAKRVVIKHYSASLGADSALIISQSSPKNLSRSVQLT